MANTDFSDLTDLLEELSTNSKKSDNVAEEAEENALSSSVRESKTRSTLTISFLVGFFVLLVFCFIFVFWYNAYAVDWLLKLKGKGIENPSELIRPLEIDKVLSIVISALGTSLGFIIGYYFKEKSK
ncbi:hypothetical protein RNP97_001109 [Enterobacter bugandensis]|uniref:hypothetical protein n=1 Tax=Enterobacter TaxID=547 RepID=UPI000F823EAF|nr:MULTISPECIES: hypothetical protein [Enterobacter]ELF8870772.1 hypothetical protein [Enterobacter bugandensis]ELQ3993515.1 hypothetical protein [Enterobacter bugandensis]ELV3037722.1 hypothetical protein [Enterobacter bugandensis]ELX8411659.1 hypothetical protein [Enterobacter bugandensis]MBT1785798.1 hypothetical protein [Enterobacter bugandensis]